MRGFPKPWTEPPGPLPGIAAKYPGVCDRCDGPINRGDRIVFRRGHAIHTHCAPGADDDV